jgi:sarcosine oxidase
VFGLATALELARRGHAVVVLDRFGPGHPATSSTGVSRSIRTAYNEPHYVALALDAIGRWRALEAAARVDILHLTGQVDLGWEPARAAIADAVAAGGGTIERRTNAQLRDLLPELGPEAGPGLFHSDAGTVIADAGLRALQDAALDAGVELLARERVTAIDASGRPVVTATSQAVEAETVVIAAGPWAGELLQMADLDLPLAPAVAQVTFLDAPAMVGRPGVAQWPEPGQTGVYGHPVPGLGYKIAFDAGTDGWLPDVERWEPDPAEERRITAWLERNLPRAPRSVAYSQRHPWTMTPDSDWVIDRRGQVVVACGCSGHAFKFGPALGPLVADVVEGGRPPDLFALDRDGLRTAARAADPISR